jgi:hypothetical protein
VVSTQKQSVVSSNHNVFLKAPETGLFLYPLFKVVFQSIIYPDTLLARFSTRPFGPFDPMKGPHSYVA